MRTCTLEGCSGKYVAKGLCRKHYSQFDRHGKTFTATIKDFNEIVDKGSYYELVLTDNDLLEVGRAKIDKEDLDKVKKIGRWSLHNQGYVYSRHKEVLMHRLVANAKKSDEVDHKKTGFKHRSDNRKKNLRKGTHSNNLCNIAKHADNTSGRKGVTWHRGAGKWMVQLMLHGKKEYLGLFSDLEEASKVYNKRAKELHKQFLHKSLVL